MADLACAADTELSVLIVDDGDIAELNRRYLGREGPTNVIAFAMGEGRFAELNPQLLGDVVVSRQTALREAAEHGLEPEEHFLRLLIHGILHLKGYDHEQGGEPARVMEELTERLLARAMKEE